MNPPTVRASQEVIRHWLNVEVTAIETAHTQQAHGGARPTFGYRQCRCPEPMFWLTCEDCRACLTIYGSCSHFEAEEAS